MNRTCRWSIYFSQFLFQSFSMAKIYIGEVLKQNFPDLIPKQSLLFNGISPVALCLQIPFSLLQTYGSFSKTWQFILCSSRKISVVWFSLVFIEGDTFSKLWLVLSYSSLWLWRLFSCHKRGLDYLTISSQECQLWLKILKCDVWLHISEREKKCITQNRNGHFSLLHIL